jgi:hypothetical protein
MPAIDLVTANEFTFTPSAFIAAYIENNKDEFNTAENTTNGGKLKTLPGDDGSANQTTISAIINANKELALAAKIAGFAPTTISAVSSGSVTDIPNTGPTVPGTVVTTAAGQASVAAASGVQGVSPGAAGPLVLNGAIIDLVGQTVEDTRTINKTVTKTYQLSVVLVLSYGTFKSPALDRAGALATVSAIYAQVQNYLNSL